ncbi:MAG: hydroxymethylbilane synthase [Bacteroidetes bacterium]|nr:hydroxymethylbilane synthase [Bacteroidota bacterium]
MKKRLRVGTRRSLLARSQTTEVIQLLTKIHKGLDIEVQTIATLGDKTTGPLPTSHIGFFTSSLETALIHEEVDFVVHSLKDLPSQGSDQLTIAAIPKRNSALDVLVTSSGVTLEQLPKGSTVGTSSLRRTAQLLSIRPDLDIELLRGNVDTRIEKILSGKLQATVLAEAGLRRLNIPIEYQYRIPVKIMLPAAAQGALAVQCRKTDSLTKALLESIDCTETRMTTSSERTFLSSTGGGCAVAMAAFARQLDHQIHLSAEVLSSDGDRKICVSGVGTDPTHLGHQLAQEAIQMGAQDLLTRG